MLPHAKLDLILRRHEEVSARLSEGPDAATFVALSRELSEGEGLVEAIRSFRGKREELDGVESMLAEPALDDEMRALAEAERDEAAASLEQLEREIRLALLPKDEADARSAILEIRPAAGGDEASLFAAELFQMYQKYAESKGWRFEVLEYGDTGLGGLKEGVAEITGRNVFARLKYESGVHRVQRVPASRT